MTGKKYKAVELHAILSSVSDWSSMGSIGKTRAQPETEGLDWGLQIIQGAHCILQTQHYTLGEVSDTTHIAVSNLTDPLLS